MCMAQKYSPFLNYVLVVDLYFPICPQRLHCPWSEFYSKFLCAFNKVSVFEGGASIMYEWLGYSEVVNPKLQDQQ